MSLIAAKKLAEDEGRTLASVVTEALRSRLSAAAALRPRFKMLVVDGSGTAAVDITDRPALCEFMERDA